MTTASIPELRKAHARTRAQLARAAVRYGKRAVAGRGSGEDGPPSDQEVALLRELLAAAEAMTAAARGNTGPPPTGNHSNSPGPVSPEPTPIHCRGCGGRRSGWTRPRPLGIRRRPSRLGRHCRRRRSLSAKWTAPAASGPARRLTMPATRPWIPADCRVGEVVSRQVV